MSTTVVIIICVVVLLAAICWWVLAPRLSDDDEQVPPSTTKSSKPPLPEPITIADSNLQIDGEDLRDVLKRSYQSGSAQNYRFQRCACSRVFVVKPERARTVFCSICDDAAQARMREEYFNHQQANSEELKAAYRVYFMNDPDGELKFIAKCVMTKKTLAQAEEELKLLVDSKTNGSDFDESVAELTAENGA
jgi:hypothetical protein